MKIRTRLTLSFTIIVALILLMFSTSVYFFYVSYRHNDFFDRLKFRAINTATLLLDINEIDSKLLKKIDDNTLTNMSDVTIIIQDKNKKLLYSNVDTTKLKSVINSYQNFEDEDKSFDHKSMEYHMTLKYIYKDVPYYIIASANDTYGQEELRELIIIMQVAFYTSLLLVLFAGFLNTMQALSPLKHLIKQVNRIGPGNIDKRVHITSGDEVVELANNFNKMLDRISVTVDTERLFVSNASHELRTPVTSIKGQIDVALISQREPQEYEAILRSIQDDVESMTVIINSFLELAQVDVESGNVERDVMRIDEVLFSMQEDFKKKKPEYAIRVEYEDMPGDESQLMVAGNERFLKIMMANLADNGCKFSENRSVSIKLDCAPDALYVKFIDNGMGIPFDEIEKVTQPLYRARNVRGRKGYGIGLSIVKKICDIHDAQLDIQSNLHFGTTVSVCFKYMDAHVAPKHARNQAAGQLKA